MRKISSQKKFHKKKQDYEKIYSQHIFKKISFERSKTILTDSGLTLKDDEIKEIIKLVNQFASLLIKEYILK